MHSAADKMDEREPSRLEIKIWNPENPLSDKEIDQFLVLARFVWLVYVVGVVLNVG